MSGARQLAIAVLVAALVGACDSPGGLLDVERKDGGAVACETTSSSGAGGTKPDAGEACGGTGGD